MARDGFSQAGDFFARAMRMQNAAALVQTQQQAPTVNNFVAGDQNVPGSPVFQRPDLDTLPSLENAAMGSPTAQPSAIVTDLLTKAREKRNQAMFGPERRQPTMSENPEPQSREIPTMGGNGTPVEDAYRPAFGRRPITSVRAGQLTG